MAPGKDEVLGFAAEWYDPRPQVVRQFLLKYYSTTHEAEMVDVAKHRVFLKRSKLPSTIVPSDFSVGSQVLIYGRELKITDYADPLTKSKLAPKSVRTAIFISDAAFASSGKIINQCEASGYMVTEVKSCLDGSGTGLAVGFKGADAISGVADIVASYGGDVKCAQSVDDVDSFSQYFSSGESTATLDSCTCVVIKPHAVKAQTTGDIIDTILSQGYEISAIQSFLLERAAAAEFMEIYKGVIPNFAVAVDELTTGIVIAMEVRAEDAVTTFRSTAGPWDVEMAKELFPKTLRGKYGVDNIRNVVHCTDLPEDGVNECTYFFDILM